MEEHSFSLSVPAPSRTFRRVKVKWQLTLKSAVKS